MNFTAVYYEPDALSYPLGAELQNRFSHLPWHEISSHNRIEEMTARPNKDFPLLKQYLIVGTRKTHRYTENQKISDYLVPFTSSGCTAMCLYCYLVCNYNKCSYLRLFVNREQMLDKILRTNTRADKSLTFEIGSNSDLILENTITGNLEWMIPTFGRQEKGRITFPTKFSMVNPLLTLEHKGRTLFRMSVNPAEIIRLYELGTSSLSARIQAVNQMCEAGYPVGILIAPVILVPECEVLYKELLETLSEKLSAKAKKHLTVEIIFMTYSYIHRAINGDAFPNIPDLYNPDQMSGRGRGKYCYRPELRTPMETLFMTELKRCLPEADLVYIC